MPADSASIELGYVVGVDLGKLADFTAIAVLRQHDEAEVVDERDRQIALEALVSGAPAVTTWNGWNVPSWNLPRLGSEKNRQRRLELVHLDRLPLGTSYPGVVEHVAQLVRRSPLRGRSRLVVDNTGVGTPVVDLLEQAGLNPVPITITAGNVAARVGRGWHVPKRDLVDTLAVLLQTKRLLVARELRYAQAFADELLAFEARITAAGHDSYGAREGSHDDLVLAVAIAAWDGLREAPHRRGDWHVWKR